MRLVTGSLLLARSASSSRARGARRSPRREGVSGLSQSQELQCGIYPSCVSAKNLTEQLLRSGAIAGFPVLGKSPVVAKLKFCLKKEGAVLMSYETHVYLPPFLKMVKIIMIESCSV